MEIPCWVTFTCSREATLNRLKDLLKVLIYANLRQGVQMFSQISRIPDLIQKFWGKRRGLYAGVYDSRITVNKVNVLWTKNVFPETWCISLQCLIHRCFFFEIFFLITLFTLLTLLTILTLTTVLILLTYITYNTLIYITYNTNIAYNASDIINNTCTTTTTHNTNLNLRY